MRSPEELLDLVADRDSFIEFVKALADERTASAELGRADPQAYLLGGAHKWQNGNIDGFLYAALEYFREKPFHQPETVPSWRMFAEFLWCGKIME